MEQKQIQLCTIEEIQSWDVVLDAVQSSPVSLCCLNLDTWSFLP